MELVINGEYKQVGDAITVQQLLQQLGIEPERVVVEVNLTILKRAQHPETVLKDGDQVEIVHFVGGGSKAAHSTQHIAHSTQEHPHRLSSVCCWLCAVC
ncbi:MAG: sulfur carrier protein ThiS [Candidatus Omnitrophica bacterium]|nr:sulfur carrier protein ThiS [Candidatus Omnitrophota bacterium]